ncbi:MULTISPECIES: hypothetical protein [Pseudomonas syringae group]|uniref:Rad50/SbcC-type AAA domain-containing protein n=1 Tax=Pseudomonas syringae pv. maculicola TaxID=59511 RepID=A0A3M6BGC2_PSEYM|nr:MULTISPECIES: hypothetical protein [Pseudomonas syringae group]KPC09547.1 Uncharacterized protein AC500_3384 [Pseudomonas amygdali pv. lachrymans]EGH97231.1 hypothetical protein PLA106_14106 [Pseudomonas amygdali pv. lachrymans str. M302278]MBM0211484.1 hypothetical protein [Pseudomonas syringae pv. maculicola]RMM13207.1 hypothetical protein ALQ85_200114 [Pseudomonas syringae]RMM74785.1 hypothetical protein ALQ72_04969 [Pseudomonas syringae pv. maculicola]
MKTTFKFDSFFGYSETNNKYFHTIFHPHINIIQGPNTSGKSTFFQLLLFTFGINDNNEQLSDILKEDAFFRLDCTISHDQKSEKITFIRDGDTLVIKPDSKPLLRFHGISANHSAEHIKLKAILHEIFGFDLYLESKGEYKAAPIEAIFLPYYVAQSVGWVYLRKSFSALDYYRNLKEDYLDYYLGITSHGDRVAKQTLESEKMSIIQKITFLRSLENNDIDIQITKLTDESFLEESKNYISNYVERQSSLAMNEKNYISHCNTLSQLSARKSVLAKVRRNSEKQSPALDTCPTCSQRLPASLEDVYSHQQAVNDTIIEQVKVKENLKEIQGKINSLKKIISTAKDRLSFEYEILKKVSAQNINFETWIQHKATARLTTEIKTKTIALTERLTVINSALAGYNTDESIIAERANKENQFRRIFVKYLDELNVLIPTDKRYLDLYKISAFPTQGVELHKTVMAYHLAINKIFESNKTTHRLPLILDAIFKEDIDPINKNNIVQFLSKNRPKDTQLFISMAQLNNLNTPSSTGQDFSNANSKKIMIGDDATKRSLFKKYTGELKNHLDETFSLLNFT